MHSSSRGALLLTGSVDCDEEATIHAGERLIESLDGYEVPSDLDCDEFSSPVSDEVILLLVLDDESPSAQIIDLSVAIQQAIDVSCLLLALDEEETVLALAEVLVKVRGGRDRWLTR